MNEIILPPLVGFTVIDTETNGLMDYLRPAHAEGQPRVAELAMIDVDLRGEIEGEWQRYIKRDGWSMMPETTKLNGITNDTLDTTGVPIADALDAYAVRILKGRAIVAFGAQFDTKMMRAEFRRAGRDDLFEQTPNICLMRAARPFAKQLDRELVKAGGSNKGWPKLTDFAAFCGVPMGAKAHGGLEDARVAALCFRYMLDNGFEAKPEVHHAKDYEAIRSNG